MPELGDEFALIYWILVELSILLSVHARLDDFNAVFQLQANSFLRCIDRNSIFSESSEPSVWVISWCVQEEIRAR
jgi:hypothetical protein